MDFGRRGSFVAGLMQRYLILFLYSNTFSNIYFVRSFDPLIVIDYRSVHPTRNSFGAISIFQKKIKIQKRVCIKKKLLPTFTCCKKRNSFLLIQKKIGQIICFPYLLA